MSLAAPARSGANDIKAGIVEPAPDAGFVEQPERQTKRGDLPFQKVWVKPGMHWNQYQELIVSPVNTQYMHKMDWLHRMSSANSAGDVKADIEELGQYFHDQVVKGRPQSSLPGHRVSGTA